VCFPADTPSSGRIREDLNLPAAALLACFIPPELLDWVPSRDNQTAAGHSIIHTALNSRADIEVRAGKSPSRSHGTNPAPFDETAKLLSAYGLTDLRASCDERLFSPQPETPVPTADIPLSSGSENSAECLKIKRRFQSRSVWPWTGHFVSVGPQSNDPKSRMISFHTLFPTTTYHGSGG